VTQLRFFNITGLIGMRVQDPAVFAGMHTLVFDLVVAGNVQGPRFDHTDGLADPGAYLQTLRENVPNVPIWVKKILTGDETLPDWSVQGATGYKAATMIARLLIDAAGAERLRAAWVEQTGGQARFHDALSIAKGDVIRRDLAAELLRLITLARNALDDAATFEAGDEALREAGIAPMTAFPRYRSYFTRNDPPVDDLALMAIVADFAGRGLRTPAVVNKIALMISAPATGALLAKAHEDTAGFRRTPILAACEVGADFDCPALTAKAMQDWARAQPGTDLILTSSHDTKRSKDARACLITWTHLLGGALALIDRAAALPAAQRVPGNVLLYLMQSVMAIWVPDDGDLGTRLAEHITKALREADEITSWTHPVETTEAAVQTLLAAMIAGGRAAPPDALARLIARGEGLALTQLAL